MINGFTIFGLEIKFYGLIIAAAMLIGIYISGKLFEKRDMERDSIFDLALIMLPSAILGARLYYVIFSGRSYTFAEFWQINNGGLAIYGGVIAGLLAIIIFCLIKKKNIATVCDCIVPALILGQALGRWGNFFNQEAYGYEVINEFWQFFPFSVYIEGAGWHLATFFYESLWNLIVFFILLKIFKKYTSSGTTAASYFILYGIGRLFIEGLRTDSLYIANSLIRVSQLLSALLIFIGILWLIFIHLKHRKEKNIENKEKEKIIFDEKF